MAKLSGKAANETITEFLGPITGRNYNVAGLATPADPIINVQVFGDGAVQVQQTQTFMMKGNDGGNAYTWSREADPSTWANLGTAINAASGMVTLNPTANNAFSAIRVIVSTAGDGKAVVQADWE